MGEHGHRQGQVDVLIGEWQTWLLIADEDAQRRAEMFAQPFDARLVDVAADELASLGLGEEMAQKLAGATAEVEDTLPLCEQSAPWMPTTISRISAPIASKLPTGSF
jgi:hypothetical protein